MAFGECLIVNNGILDLTNDISLCVIKCLREVDDENLIKKSAEATAVNDVVRLTYQRDHFRSPSVLPFTLSDWEAVAFFCKHMKNLISLNIHEVGFGYTVDVTKLLEQRCMKQLHISCATIGIINVTGLFSALLKSTCTVKHEHSKITELGFSYSSFDDSESDISSFFKNGHAHYLEKLFMVHCFRWLRIASSFIEVLEHCPNLTYLDLSQNELSYENVRVLCGQKLFNLTQLYLEECSLKDECIPPICEFLTDERCNLTRLSFRHNHNLSDESLRMLGNRVLIKEHCKLEYLNVSQCLLKDSGAQELCKALQNEHCKLIELDLVMNELTDQCIRDLCKALKSESKLTVLFLAYNKGITNEGLRMLCELLLAKKLCNLGKLNLRGCSLSNNCIPYLCKALQNEHCKLIELDLGWNKLTDQCIPDLCEALKSKTKLTVLSLAYNRGITNEGLRMLCELLLTNEHCNLEKLILRGCLLSNDCIPHLREAVENEHFSLKELTLKKHMFSKEERRSLRQSSDKIKFKIY